MNSRDAFKIGFLLRCADAGLTAADAMGLAKQAAALLQQKAAAWSDLVNTPLQYGASALGAAAIGVPVAAGIGAGLLAGEISGSGDADAEDVKKKELIDEFRHYARRARERQAAKTLKSF